MRRLFLFLFMLFSLSAISQEYKYGIGGRAGISNGVSLKAFVMKRDDNYIAFEALGGLRDAGTVFTALVEYQKEIHIPKMRYAALYWYTGVGPHMGVYPLNSAFKNRQNVTYTSGVMNFGVDAVGGVEYVFADLPLSLGFDFRPFFDLVNPGFRYFDAGATVRFAIK